MDTKLVVLIAYLLGIATDILFASYAERLKDEGDE